MRYVEYTKPGPPSAMLLAQTSQPVPKHNEVLIQVAYAGVNRPDCLQRSGLYPPPPSASPILGLEASGVVVACGESVRRWRVGDKVCALTNGGAYAEYVCAPEGQVLAIPSGMDFLSAAAIPENYFTVAYNMLMRGGLTASESVLIHGGTSGIGLTAIKLARLVGAKPITTVGSAQKAEAANQAGALLSINYRSEDFVARTLEWTQNQGVNMVLDIVGGEYTDRNLKCLAPMGRLVQIAFLQGSKVQLDLLPLMTKRLMMTGSTLRPRTDAEKASIAEYLREQILPHLARGQARPVIDSVFDLSEVVKAHERMESSAHIGKIMLKVAS